MTAADAGQVGGAQKAAHGGVGDSGPEAGVAAGAASGVAAGVASGAARRGGFVATLGQGRWSLRIGLALLFSLVCLGAGAWRANHMQLRATEISGIARDVLLVEQEARQIALWLRAEEALPGDLGRGRLAPMAVAAMQAATRLEALHDRVMRTAWAIGIENLVSEETLADFQRPTHQMDMMVRGFLRGVDRAAESVGERRSAARAELTAAVDGALASGIERAVTDLDAAAARLREQGALSLVFGVAGAGLGLVVALMVHFSAFTPVMAAASRKLSAVEIEAAEIGHKLRSAQRDRARMLDLAAAGLDGAAERMEAAADLLSRTPLTDTQLRVLAGLRHALAELTLRLEGQRLLSAHGDGRLRAAPRPLRPAEALEDWLDLARRRAAEQGRTLVAEADLDAERQARGDAGLMRKALDRLLDDALRRAGKGGAVRLRLKMEGREEGRTEIIAVFSHEGRAPGPGEIAAARNPFAERPPSENVMSRGADPFALAVAAAICTASGGALDLAGDGESGGRAAARFRFAGIGEGGKRSGGRPAAAAASEVPGGPHDDVSAALEDGAPDTAPEGEERRRAREGGPDRVEERRRNAPPRRRSDRMRDASILAASSRNAAEGGAAGREPDGGR